MREKYYGTVDKEGVANLSDLTFGHRFRDGQTQMEYLLEFLNVFVGFGRSLEPSPGGYRRMKRLGLRRFVFGVGQGELPDDKVYDGDVKALELLEERLGKKIEVYHDSSSDSLEVLRSLFRSFTGVERKRSWYAKSLFPICESVLWWEGLRPASQAKVKQPNPKAWTLEKDPDEGFSTSARNFFARGGEMVYLMLAVGCQNQPDLRRRIERGLTRLLSQNQTLGEVAELIENTWQEIRAERGWKAESTQETDKGNLGYIWAGHESLFAQFAEDVDNLLSRRLDPIEQIELLMHLVAYYVVLYFNHRARALVHSGMGEPTTIFVDALERPGVIRHISSQSYQRNHELLTWAAEELVVGRLLEAAESQLDMKDILSSALPEMSKTWEKKALPQVASDVLTPRFIGVLHRLGKPIATGNTPVHNQRLVLVDTLFRFVMQESEADLEHVIYAHQALCKEMKLVVPKKGPGAHYSLSGGLLKALVIASVPAQEGQVEFGEFVERIFNRYGIVIGPEQVTRAATWLQEVDINFQHYQDNLDMFKDKLRTAGLLKEYSDATALVITPTTKEGVS